ncbi:sugar phosphate isomerase/epimerase family protein [Geodermatophilus sp. SYSU D00697]
MTAEALAGNPLGIQAAVWTEELSVAALAPVLGRAAELGYDVVELLVPDPAALDPRAVRRAAEAAGVGLGMVTALGPSSDVSSDDPAHRRRGEEHLRASLDAASELGAGVLGGVLYGALGRHTAAADAAAVERSAAVLRSVAADTDASGAVLALEVVSRYGSNLLNTAEQARAFCALVAHPRVGVHLDTFHMHIEERDIAGAVRTAAPHLMHVHVGENDRGHLGEGRFPFPEFFAALGAAGYRGAITVETFSPAVTPRLAAAVAAWRTLWHDPDDLARSALAHLCSATGRGGPPAATAAGRGTLAASTPGGPR